MIVVNHNNNIVKMWTDGITVEEKAMQQILNVSGMPFIHKHVAVMPDAHFGIGATVGSVIPTIGAIIPASVGVDIGCGMIAKKTPIKAKDLPDNLSELRAAIEYSIPHGRSDNGGGGDIGARHQISQLVHAYWECDRLQAEEYSQIITKYPQLKPRKHPVHHLGTLGTGNHFIELCLDENDDVWIMLHSGSRGIGNKIGCFFIEKAKEEMARWHIARSLPDIDLAYLVENTEIFNDYCFAVNWAQKFAALNRGLMMSIVENILFAYFRECYTGKYGVIHEPQTAINCHHNYIARENHFNKNVWVTRKGAIRAREGDLGIIPGSMGAKSFIVRGKGNPESFHSCSHGAGRIMSRTEAKKTFTIDDHINSTLGVECRKDIDVIDETPRAYKDIEKVMAAQSDLIEVVHTLKQFLCIKG